MFANRLTGRAAALGAEIRAHRQDIARVALQTVVASAATYLVFGALGAPHLSWAVIAALFTIGLSVDASAWDAMGRIAGAFLGVALGLAAVWAIGRPVVISLAVAAALANMIAVPWPGLRYGAVTAAIVALDPSPEAANGFERAGAIMIGTLIGAASALVIWPVLGRDRVILALRQVVEDCCELLELIGRGVTADERARRDAVHARLTARLEAARAGEARFAPRLANGVALPEAVATVARLWHAIVILDRALRGQHHALGEAAVAELRPALDDGLRAACAHLGEVSAAMRQGRAAAAAGAELRRALGRAGAEAARLAVATADEGPVRGKALHAFAFGIEEVERSLLELGRAVAASDSEAAAEARLRRTGGSRQGEPPARAASQPLDIRRGSLEHMRNIR